MAKQKTTAPAPTVKDRILAAASRLFRFQGYSETGINQIIDEAEVARASLYLHYPTKEVLGRAYLKSYSETQLELLAQALLEYETLTGDEITQLLDSGKIDRPDEPKGPISVQPSHGSAIPKAGKRFGSKDDKGGAAPQGA